MLADIPRPKLIHMRFCTAHNIAPHAMLCKQLQRNRLRLKVQFCGVV